MSEARKKPEALPSGATQPPKRESLVSKVALKDWKPGRDLQKAIDRALNDGRK